MTPSKAFRAFEELEEKLEKILGENGLVHEFETERYPICMIIQPRQDTGAQMQLFAGDAGTSSTNMKILLTFRLDGLEIQTDNRLVIQDALLTKIKGLATKMHYAYLQADFAIRNCASHVHVTATKTDWSDAGDTGHVDADGGTEAFAAFLDEAENATTTTS